MVVDSLVVPFRDGFGDSEFPFELEGVFYEDDEMEPIDIEVRDPGTGIVIPLKVIAVMDQLSDAFGELGVGMFASRRGLDDLVGDTETTIASKGEFRFDIAGDSTSELHVLKGKVMLATAGSSQELKKKQVAEVTVAGVQVAKFKNFAEDPLTAWHEQRSETISASVYTAPGYFGMGELPDASRSGISR